MLVIKVWRLPRLYEDKARLIEKDIVAAVNRSDVPLLVKEMVKQGEEMFAEVGAGKMEDNYLGLLSKDTCWGRAVIALAEAFDVPLPEEPASAAA